MRLLKPARITFLSLSLGIGAAVVESGAMSVQACFSPVPGCADRILRAISSARREVLVAVYAFTNDELAQALVQAHRRGVNVQVVLDREFDQENGNSKGNFLEKQGIKLRRVSGLKPPTGDKGSGLMHQKFAVLDRSIVITGSYNWTAAAEKFNHENLLLFHDAAPLAEDYRSEFFRLWNKKP
ncbi:MAG TPA: phospholipase D family protein [Candidatus Acidoferrales bacterium]|nr:phospholipase D family protein [Candidatus Acidoferrales bacterium]